MGRRQTGDGHPEGTAAHIVQARLMTEGDALGITAVFAADAHMQVRPHPTSTGHRHLDQLADAQDVQLLEGVLGQYLRSPHI